MATTLLYTPEVLGLATSLALWPLHDALPLQGEARSPSCGSTLRVGVALDTAGRIADIGIATQACAIGQASAAIMIAAAVGRGLADFQTAQADIAAWLTGDAPLPAWPGIAVIGAARAFPGRHGAILLGWRAVLAALSPDRATG